MQKSTNMEKIILAGGSGFLGRALSQHFGSRYEVIVLTRNPRRRDSSIKWDAKTKTYDWSQYMENAAVIINLCGKSVDCRYNKKNMAEIFASRLESTSIIGQEISQLKSPPKLWINAASATIYRHSEDKPMSEKGEEFGEGFSVEVCKAWEDCFNKFDLPFTRKVNLRLAMVLGKDGGVYPVLKKLTKMGLGGKMGNGRQRISWLHVKDFCWIIEWLIENPKAHGVYNASAPEILSNKDFMGLLRDVEGVSFGLPASKWMLEAGAFFLRTETELILKSRFVYPEKLLQEGFVFQYPKVGDALKSLK
jgi:uncharacterized protein (TIGR01777 family)